jgi:outer membrane protein OmpA-like peptidoglycan-associated protein
VSKREVICVLGVLVVCAPAHADEPRLHATAGAAHAVGGDQQREFGFGGGGSATAELPVSRLFGVQATGGAIGLSQGQPPRDPGLARQSTGSAFLGTIGARLHPLGATRVAGPWIDGNAGLAHTGGEGRVAFTSNLGWDFRLSRQTRWDVGPFVGYTHIFQSDAALRPDDARVVLAGISLSLGARSRSAASPPPPRRERTTRVIERDGPVEARSACPGGQELVDEVCQAPTVRAERQRIVIEDEVHFEFDSPTVKSESHDLLRRIVNFIITHPNIGEVTIEGHADAVGTDEYNRALSEKRAEATRALLVRFGLPASMLRAVGHGRAKPKVVTDAPSQENRRVEFLISREAEEGAGEEDDEEDDDIEARPETPEARDRGPSTPSIARGAR